MRGDLPVWNMVMALVAPFMLWPLEMLLPYPYVVEELAKLVLVWKPAREGQGWGMGALIGFLFALSETMLYLVNAISLGKIGILGPRIILTMPMHVLTTVIIYLGARWGWVGGLIGLVIGMGMHWGFNSLVDSI